MSLKCNVLITLFCNKTQVFSKKIGNTYINNPDRKLTVDKSTNTTKVHLDESMSFIGVMSRNSNYSKTAASLRPSSHTWQLTKFRNMEHNAHFEEKSTGWRVSFLSDSVCLSFFKGAPLIFVFSRQLVWSLSLLCSLAFLKILLEVQLISSENAQQSLFLIFREGIRQSGQFQKLFEANLNCSSCGLRRFVQNRPFQSWGNYHIVDTQVKKILIMIVVVKFII